MVAAAHDLHDPEVVPGFDIKHSGERRHGAPKEWDFAQLARLFADIEFLKDKDSAGVRKVCETLAKRKGYAGRWGRYKAGSLRQAYTRARRLYETSFDFKLQLCGLQAVVSDGKINCIEAAIERHALQL